MHIGSHFGKRKPKWNFFDSFLSDLKSNHQDKIKFLFNFILIQSIMLLPMLYWSLENYNFIDKHFNIPAHLKNALDIEKQWIVIVYFITVTVNFFMSFKFIYDLTKKENTYNEHLKAIINSGNSSQVNKISSDNETLLGVSAGQRHVS